MGKTLFPVVVNVQTDQLRAAYCEDQTITFIYNDSAILSLNFQSVRAANSVWAAYTLASNNLYLHILNVDSVDYAPPE